MYFELGRYIYYLDTVVKDSFETILHLIQFEADRSHKGSLSFVSVIGTTQVIMNCARRRSRFLKLTLAQFYYQFCHWILSFCYFLDILDSQVVAYSWAQNREFAKNFPTHSMWPNLHGKKFGHMLHFYNFSLNFKEKPFYGWNYRKTCRHNFQPFKRKHFSLHYI